MAKTFFHTKMFHKRSENIAVLISSLEATCGSSIAKFCGNPHAFFVLCKYHANISCEAKLSHNYERGASKSDCIRVLFASNDFCPVGCGASRKTSDREWNASLSQFIRASRSQSFNS